MGPSLWQHVALLHSALVWCRWRSHVADVSALCHQKQALLSCAWLSSLYQSLLLARQQTQNSWCAHALLSNCMHFEFRSWPEPASPCRQRWVEPIPHDSYMNALVPVQHNCQLCSSPRQLAALSVFLSPAPADKALSSQPVNERRHRCALKQTTCFGVMGLIDAGHGLAG